MHLHRAGIRIRLCGRDLRKGSGIADKGSEGLLRVFHGQGYRTVREKQDGELGAGLRYLIQEKATSWATTPSRQVPGSLPSAALAKRRSRSQAPHARQLPRPSGSATTTRAALSLRFRARCCLMRLSMFQESPMIHIASLSLFGKEDPLYPQLLGPAQLLACSWRP